MMVACWLILDPVHVVFHILEVPAWANRLVVIPMVICFPVVYLAPADRVRVWTAN